MIDEFCSIRVVLQCENESGGGREGAFAETDDWTRVWEGMDILNFALNRATDVKPSDKTS